MKYLRATLALFTSALLIAAAQAAEPTPRIDAKGSADHPLIKRFAGSWLIGYFMAEWDEAAVPASAELNKSDSYKLKELVSIEGKVTRLLYISPPGKSPLEVWRNYEQALNTAGLKKRFACERECADLYFAWSKQLDPTKGFSWSKGYIDYGNGTQQSFSSALAFDQGRMLVGTLGKPGQEASVLLYNSVAAHAESRQVATYIQIIEPKAMPTGQVTVAPQSLQASLATDGRVTLSGLFFDTGKTELKTESKAQLEAMNQLLQSQPTLKVYIVGHTDNVGGFEANQSLSQARAQAVVAALSAAPYKVDGKRLMAKGLASLAPVASNGEEAGRAKNRRVELVAQ